MNQVNSMRTAIKYRLMVAFSVVCLLGLVAQSVYLLQLQDRQLQDRLAQAGLDDDPVSAIEAKILDNLDTTDPAQGNPDPFAWPSALPMDPFASIQQMQQQLDSLFGSMNAGRAFPPAGFGQIRSGLTTLAIEVEETPTEYRVTIAVPPATEIELNTSLEDNALTVHGLVKSESADQRSNVSTSIVSQSQFSRTIELPQPVDALGMSTSKTAAGVVILIPKQSV